MGSQYGETGLAHIQSLEQRRMLSASIDDKGALTVTGTSKGEFIRLERNVNIVSQLLVRVGKKVVSFTASSVKSINVSGLGGNDHIEIDDVGIHVPCTIHGNDGDDSILGSVEDDRILGGAGDDSIDGSLGNDRIYGQKGADSLVGGKDDDSIDGGDGNDTVVGESGADRCYGGDGDDSIRGGGSRDLISGGGGVDSLFGNEGKDLFDNTDAASEDIDLGASDRRITI